MMIVWWIFLLEKNYDLFFLFSWFLLHKHTHISAQRIISEMGLRRYGNSTAERKTVSVIALGSATSKYIVVGWDMF